MFFARKVVFVEGETEKTTLPFLAHKLGVFDPEVSVIDCGSKQNLILYIELANAFQIPYLVVFDEDNAEDSFNEKIKKALRPELGKHIILDPKFEVVAEIPDTKANRKKGKALAALDHFEMMIETNGIESIPQRIKEVVLAAFGRVEGEKA